MTVIVSPGEIDATKSRTDLGVAPITAVAGLTKFFAINTFDLFSNKEIVSYNATNITIIAKYVDNTQYVSPLGLSDITNWA